ncbi:hypothetical protein V5F49_11200 [Xanthobacter sp. V3C-3]|uniref:hypothetical protein n=1 Tax=Xanthobacter lutulentifluminis TaxID=3119935 RepID=UPI003728F48A
MIRPRSIRVRCCVPFCNRTERAEAADREVLCQRHYMATPRPLRVEYEAAWREADKADQRRADGLDVSMAPYLRVTNAFEALKSAAMETAP